MNIEQVITRITVPEGDPQDIEIAVKRENDLVVVCFYGYESTVSRKRFGWEVHLTPEKAETLLRGLQDLSGPARPGGSVFPAHIDSGE